MKLFAATRSTFVAASLGLSLLGLSNNANAADLTPVDLELSFLVDVSGSVSNSEFNLQRDAYETVFKDANLFEDFISQGELGTIAVNLIYWSSSGQQEEAVGWTLIDSVQASQDFASAVAAAPRNFSGSTAPGSAIDFATPRFFNNDFDGTRLVMDVSGDGQENDGLDTATARNNAIASGIDSINGLVIGNNSSVLNFYENEVKGGSDSFVSQVDDFTGFGAALQNKIEIEISNGNGQDVPEPASVVSLLALGALGTGSVLKRQKKE
jgi:hypothetical protein